MINTIFIIYEIIILKNIKFNLYCKKYIYQCFVTLLEFVKEEITFPSFILFR